MDGQGQSGLESAARAVEERDAPRDRYLPKEITQFTSARRVDTQNQPRTTCRNAVTINFFQETKMNFRKLMLTAVLTLAAVQAAWAADVTGTWLLSVETPAGAGNPTLTLKQAGETVTGDYKGRLGEAPVSGTIKGNALAISYKVSAQGTDLEVKYTGTVDGNSMSGKVSLGQMGEGTFKGTKQ
jgi:hypothetical protein